MEQCGGDGDVREQALGKGIIKYIEAGPRQVDPPLASKSVCEVDM